MSFFTKYLELCTRENSNANAIAKKIGIRSSTVTNWKKGGTPQPHTLKKVADYFGVPVEYFSEETEKSPAPSAGTEDIMKIYNMLTPERKQQFLDSMTALLKEQLQA